MFKKYIACALSLCILNLTAGGGASTEKKEVTQANIQEIVASKETLDTRLKDTLFKKLVEKTPLTQELANRRIEPIVIMSTIARNYDRYFTKHKIQQQDQDAMYGNTNDLLDILFEKYPKTLQQLKRYQGYASSSDEE